MQRALKAKFAFGVRPGRPLVQNQRQSPLKTCSAGLPASLRSVSNGPRVFSCERVQPMRLPHAAASSGIDLRLDELFRVGQYALGPVANIATVDFGCSQSHIGNCPGPSDVFNARQLGAFG
jgi:hypothetical protein